MERILPISESDLQSLLIEAARLGASEVAIKYFPPIMTKQEVAAYLGKSVPTIDRYMREGMPYRKEGNGHPEFHKGAVDRWLNERFQTV